MLSLNSPGNFTAAKVKLMEIKKAKIMNTMALLIFFERLNNRIIHPPFKKILN